MIGKAFNSLMGGAIKRVKKPEPLKAAGVGAAIGAGMSMKAKGSSQPRLQVQPSNGTQKTQRSAQLHKLSPGVEMTPNQMLQQKVKKIGGAGPMRSSRGRRAVPARPMLKKYKKMEYAEKRPM